MRIHIKSDDGGMRNPESADNNRGDDPSFPCRTHGDMFRLAGYGYAYEKGINEVIIDTFDDYITQIEIPVKQENE